MLKNPKLWGSIIAVGLMLVGLFTGMDLKKVVCEGISASAPVSGSLP